MSRISILLIVPLIIATILFSTGQLEASSVDPARTQVFWPNGRHDIPAAQSGTGPDPADLSISKSASGDPVVGTDLTYTLVITNNSASVDAQNVIVTDNLPPEVNLKSVTPQGICTGTSSISCNLGTLNKGLSTTIILVVTPTKAGTIINTATVSADNSDSIPENNSYSVSTAVIGQIFLPIMMVDFPSTPDLIVESLIPNSNHVTVVIRNVGYAPVTDPFWVDVYFNPTETPRLNQIWQNIASHGVAWNVKKSLAPNEALILTSRSDYYVPSQSSSGPLPVGVPVYALVDSFSDSTIYGAIPESKEDNNLINPPVLSTAGTESDLELGSEQEQTPYPEGLPRR